MGEDIEESEASVATDAAPLGRSRRRRRAKKKKQQQKEEAGPPPVDVSTAFAMARRGVTESTSDASHKRDWNKADRKLETFRAVNARRAELWEKLMEMVPRRDRALQQYEEIEAKGKQLLEEDHTATRHSKAVNKSVQCRNVAAAHRMHKRRLRELNDAVAAYSLELCELEEAYPPTDQDRLDELFRAAVDDDAPKAMLEILKSIRSTRQKGSARRAGEEVRAQCRAERDAKRRGLPVPQSPITAT